MTSESEGGTKRSRTALPQGFRLDEYEIKRTLGIGGFGITYLAVDPKLQTEVALKEYFPLNIAVRDEQGVVRAVNEKAQPYFQKGLEDFVREARILASFSHPNIVSVLRFVEALGTAYLVMEYAQGESLRKHFGLYTDRGMPESEVRAILEPLVDGLTDLHAQGIIHRDIKPDNIFIREDRTPLLIDFGGARDFSSTEGTDLSYVMSPNYTPLEQHGKRWAQGPWSDIYGLGAVAYAMLTTKNPVSSDKRAEGERLPPVRSAAIGNYSDALLNAVDAALELDPERRPQSLAQWRDMLECDRSLQDSETATIERAYRQVLDLIDETARALGVGVDAEEATAFSLAFSVADLSHRRHTEIVTGDAWELCEQIVSGGKETSGREAERIRETFRERFRDYAAAYTLDRSAAKGRFELTAEHVLKHVFGNASSRNDAARERISAAVPEMLARAAERLQTRVAAQT